MTIEWNNSFECNSLLIETQLRMIMLSCRRLDISIKSGQSGQAIYWVMNELVKSTEFHFVSQENLMREIRYPNAGEHALVHGEFLRQLNMMMARISHHKNSPEDFNQFFHKWLSQHMTDEDLQVAKYINNATQRPAGEDVYAEYLLSKK